MNGTVIAWYALVMTPLRARVHNGRLVLDEPTNLPEGKVIELVPVVELKDPPVDAVEALRKKVRGEPLTKDEAEALAACSRPVPPDAVPHAQVQRILEERRRHGA